MSVESGPVVALRGVAKRHGVGEREVWALRDVSLEIQRGEFVSLIGPSGSGKTTLLNLIAGLDFPSSGEVCVGGETLARLSHRELAQFRRRTVALVFQFFNLLPTLTAAENVAVPLRADGRPRDEVDRRVAAALDAVGLARFADRFPEELSGGEMQRVAIARAMVTQAPIILADEPTGNLDSARGAEIMELLKRSSERDHRTVVLVTHDLRAAAYGDRIITLRDGRIVDEVVGAQVPHLKPVQR